METGVARLQILDRINPKWNTPSCHFVDSTGQAGLTGCRNGVLERFTQSGRDGAPS
jgi:hypothetical protein